MNKAVTKSSNRDPGAGRGLVRGFVLCAGLIFLPSSLRADGGVVRVREERAPFIITVFSPAEIVARKPTDITVLVQDSRSGEVITDATVDVILTAPGGVKEPSPDPFCTAPMNVQMIGGISAGSSATFRAARDHSANKLLYGLPVMLNAPGEWNARASVWRNGQPVSVSCEIPVRSAGGQLAGLWFVLAIPPGAIGLFALNQRLRRRAGSVAWQAATQ